MTPQQAIRAFGSKDAIAKICSITATAVYMWERRGGIPYDKQCLLEIEARRIGKPNLRAKRDHDPKYREREAA